MQFQVPQFIEVEDKIFGPLTFRQFVYLAGGAGFCFILYALIPYLFLALIPIVAVAGLSFALAFLKYNGRSFIHTLEAFVKYLYTKKLYIWRKAPNTTTVNPVLTDKSSSPVLNIPKLSDSKLKELSWSLDIKENNYE